jgi:AraC family transcriptional regulator, positive regulator of tynA and feaB
MSCGSARVADLVSGKKPDIEARDLTICCYFVRNTTLGPVTVCKTVGSPHRSFREQKELARTNHQTFNLLLTLQTPWAVDHRGSLFLAPRDVLIVDSRYPLITDIRSSFTSVCVTVSDTWLRQWLPNPNLMAARRIPGDSLSGLALSSYLSELSSDLAAAPPLPVSVIADQVGSLLALTATAVRDATLAYTPAVRSLYEHILDCLTQRCTEPELTAVDVANSVGVSVRTLHRVFASANETFGGKLLEARVRVALRMLTSRFHSGDNFRDRQTRRLHERVALHASDSQSYGSNATGIAARIRY